MEWCFPPKLFPICGNEALVRDFDKNIAICLGRVTVFELFLLSAPFHAAFHALIVATSSEMGLVQGPFCF